MAWIAPVIQAGVGLFQTISASQAAKNLPDRQQYQVSPEMRRAESMALRRAEQGMSAAERAAFEQGMARRTGAAERAMRNLGMGGVASGISSIFNIDAMNQMAAQSESMRRAGEQQYATIANQIQNIADQETRSFNDMLMRQQMALGQAGASGMKNLTGGFMNLATGGFGGGNTTTPTYDTTPAYLPSGEINPNAAAFNPPLPEDYFSNYTETSSPQTQNQSPLGGGYFLPGFGMIGD